MGSNERAALECDGKVKHATKAEADEKIRRIRYRERGSVVANDPERNPTLIAYKCRFCGSFHVGHGSRKMKEAMQLGDRARDFAVIEEADLLDELADLGLSGKLTARPIGRRRI